jgi:hypothetical protein
MKKRLPSVWLLLWAIAGAVSPCHADAAEAEDRCDAEHPRCGWRWGPAGEDLLVYSLAQTSENDPDGEDLRGFRLNVIRWKESKTKYLPGVKGGFWLSGARNQDVEVYGAGVELGFFFSPLGPVRIGGRATFGIVHREGIPDRSWGLVEGIGLDAGVWLGRRVQLAVTVDLEIDQFSWDTTSRTGLVFRAGTARDSYGPRSSDP